MFDVPPADSQENGSRPDGERPRKKSKWDEKGPDPIPSPLPRVPLPNLAARQAVRTKVLSIPAIHKGALIGKGGEAITAIRAASAAEIHIKQTESEHLLTITISGSNVELAERLIGERLAASGRWPEAGGGWEARVLEVPQDLIGPVIGREGSSLRELQERTGCKFKFVAFGELEPSLAAAAAPGLPAGRQVALVKGPIERLTFAEQALQEKLAEVGQQRRMAGPSWASAEMGAGACGAPGALAGGSPCMPDAFFGKGMGKDLGKGPAFKGPCCGKGMLGMPGKGRPEVPWEGGGSMEVDAGAKGHLGTPNWGWWGKGGKRRPPIPCKFQMKGFCKNGERCTFSHDPEAIRQALGEAPAATMENIWDPGYKMIYCKYWDSGKCTRGATCSFAHGIEELRGGLTLENLSIMDEAQQMMSTSLRVDEVEQRLLVLKAVAQQGLIPTGFSPGIG